MYLHQGNAAVSLRNSEKNRFSNLGRQLKSRFAASWETQVYGLERSHITAGYYYSSLSLLLLLQFVRGI